MKKQTVTLALLNQKIDSLSEIIEKIDNTINGVEDQPGLKGRLSLIEEFAKSSRWYFRTIWAAIIAAAIGIYFKG